MLTGLRLRMAKFLLPKDWVMEKDSYLKQQVLRSNHIMSILVYTSVKLFMEERYGEDWRNDMYEFVNMAIEEHEQELNKLDIKD